jgi:LmbE family N-acetylglucosaminyl deacetylase
LKLLVVFAHPDDESMGMRGKNFLQSIAAMSLPPFLAIG